MSDPTVKQRKPRRRLAASEKYEMFVAVLTEQCTQREAAARWDVDRTAVVHTCRVAKQGASDALAAAVPGRPGQTAEAIVRRVAARGAAVAFDGDRASGGPAPARGKKRSRTKRRPGPVQGGRGHQGRPARPDRPCRVRGLVDPSGRRAARCGS